MTPDLLTEEWMSGCGLVQGSLQTPLSGFTGAGVGYMSHLVTCFRWRHVLGS